MSLIPEEPSQDLRDFCACEGIKLNFILSEKFKGTPVLLMPVITQVLEMVIDPNNQPAYIHCLDGGHVSGTVVIALRMLQGWDPRSIVEEHRRYDFCYLIYTTSVFIFSVHK